MSAADFGHARLLLAQEKPPVILDDVGWPSSLHIGAIAALQTGHIFDHATRMQRYESWCSALTYAARVNGALHFEDLEYAREPWVEAGIERGFRVVAAAWIAAADLARWMQSNDEEIGPLLALWFKALGVTYPERQHPTHGGTDNTLPLADWQALVAYRKANKSKDWGLGNQLDILRAELAHRVKGNKATETDALAAMAKDIGIGREGLRKALKLHRNRAKEAASSYTSTVFRAGKKVDSKVT